MKFSAWPASGSWINMHKDWLHLAEHGWHGIWSMDHFMAPNDSHENPVSESFTSLSALSALIPEIKIGTMVTGNTYRHPGVLAKMAVNIDHISEGRFTLGIGCGWQEIEHNSFGIPFPSVPERVKMLDESAQILSELLSGKKTNFSGNYYQFDDAKLSPAPFQSKIPLLIGGGGEKVTLRTVAQYADAWNIWARPNFFKKKLDVLEEHCSKINRDSSTIHKTVAINILFSDDKNLVDAKSKDSWSLVGGNIDQVSQTIGEFNDIGVDEVIIAAYDKNTYKSQPLDDLDIFADEIIKLFH